MSNNYFNHAPYIMGYHSSRALNNVNFNDLDKLCMPEGLIFLNIYLPSVFLLRFLEGVSLRIL